MPALTPWFPASVKPVHRGVYPTELLGEGWGGYSHWSGKRWGLECDTPEEALEAYSSPWADQNKPWRGLAAKP